MRMKKRKSGIVMSAVKLTSQSAKKFIKIVAYFLFIIAYAVFLGLFMECLLVLLSMCMDVSLDGGSVVDQFPRFIPFCVVVEFLALVALVLLAILNIKASERLDYTKRICLVQTILAFVVSIPMIKLWEMLFDYMQKVF